MPAPCHNCVPKGTKTKRIVGAAEETGFARILLRLCCKRM